MPGIVTDPDLLAVPSAPVPEGLKGAVIAALIKFTKSLGRDCAGLSGVQIGLPYRVFVIRDDKGGFIPFVDPRVKSFSKEKGYSLESCLSFPGRKKMVGRHKVIVLSDGTILKGTMAVEFQHEFDHTNGVTLFNRSSADAKAA